MWGNYKTFPRYGVTGNSDGSWDVDIFWGNAIRKGYKAVEHIKRFKPGKINEADSVEIQEQVFTLNIRRSTVTNGFKAYKSCKAKEAAFAYMKKMRKEQPVRERPVSRRQS